MVKNETRAFIKHKCVLEIREVHLGPEEKQRAVHQQNKIERDSIQTINF